MNLLVYVRDRQVLKPLTLLRDKEKELAGRSRHTDDPSASARWSQRMDARVQQDAAVATLAMVGFVEEGEKAPRLSQS